MPTYEFPRPALTADVIVLRGDPGQREVLLIRRAADPFRDCWALPGGFVDENEPLETAARRELREETGLELEADLVAVGTYGDPGRDPRGWTVTVAFVVALDLLDVAHATAGDDAAEVRWFPASALPRLAFDHDVIVADALRVASFGA
jgi:8-oxo-dGTP diphosphatase